MTERTTPVLSRAQAFKIADALAQLLGQRYTAYEPAEEGGDLATPEDLRAFLYGSLSKQFVPAPALTPANLQATAAEMMFTGGSFVQALGTALMRADADNRARLIAAFPELIERYSKIVMEGK